MRSYQAFYELFKQKRQKARKKKAKILTKQVQKVEDKPIYKVKLEQEGLGYKFIDQSMFEEPNKEKALNLLRQSHITFKKNEGEYSNSSRSLESCCYRL